MIPRRFSGWIRSLAFSSGYDRCLRRPGSASARGLAGRSDAAQEVIVKLLGVVKSQRATAVERRRALMTIADALFPNSETGDCGLDLAASEGNAGVASSSAGQGVQRMNSQQAAFADRVRELMETKRISQQELAARAGCSQPAISQMLNRTG